MFLLYLPDPELVTSAQTTQLSDWNKHNDPQDSVLKQWDHRTMVLKVLNIMLVQFFADKETEAPNSKNSVITWLDCGRAQTRIQIFIHAIVHSFIQITLIFNKYLLSIFCRKTDIITDLMEFIVQCKRWILINHRNNYKRITVMGTVGENSIVYNES